MTKWKKRIRQVEVFKQHLEKVKKVQPNELNDAIFTFLISIEKEILDINRREQLLKGVDANNDPLFSKRHQRGVYSKATEQISGGRKVAGTHYTLEDTGDFFKGFFLEFDKDRLLFGSRDSKTSLLIGDYGDIFGLTPKNLSTLIQNRVKPFLINHIRQQLGL